MKLKKILALLLIISIMISLLPTPIFAVNPVKFSIIPSVSEAHPGDEITYTVKMSAVQNLAGMKFKLLIPDGLTFVEGKEVEGLQTTLNAAKAEFTPATLVFVVGSSNYSCNEDTTLMTFKCTVDSETVGEKEVTFIIDNDDIFDTTADMNNIPIDYSNPGSTVEITPRPIPSIGISLNKTNISLEQGTNEKLIATIEPTDSTDTITWESSDETKAKVDENGKVTAVSEGTATITAKTTSGKTATCTVTVIKPVCKHTSLTTVLSKQPTCTTIGNDEYQICDDCGKAFKMDGTTETTIEAETIKALGHDFSIPRYNDTQHWYECSRCGIADTKINHVGEGDYQKDSINHWKVCGCGTKVNIEAHTAGEPVKENVVPATCTKEGSYDEVVYCPVCNYEMSRTPKAETAKGHTAGEPVKENIVPATCTAKGSYDEVVYCSVCSVEISRTNKETDMIPHDVSLSDWSSDETNHWKECGCGIKVDIEAHIAGKPLKENIVPATCTEAGNHDEVVYCLVCNREMSRTNKIDEATGHTEATSVKENIIPATCTEEGTYDEVVYCSVCGEELARIEKTIPVKGHTEGAVIIENEIESTVDKEGSYEEVIYCTECDKELSRTKKTTQKFVYEILEGANSLYQKLDSNGITIKTNGKFEKFEGIEVDGKVVDKSNYIAKEGTTIVTLKTDYLNTLSEGEHKIKFLYDDGDVETTFEIIKNTETENDKQESNTPNTYDLSNITLWKIGMAVSGILFVILLGCKIKGTKRKGRH